MLAGSGVGVMIRLFSATWVLLLPYPAEAPPDELRKTSLMSLQLKISVIGPVLWAEKVTESSTVPFSLPITCSERLLFQNAVKAALPSVNVLVLLKSAAVPKRLNARLGLASVSLLTPFGPYRLV